MANCEGPCDEWDGTGKRWFKVWETGYSRTSWPVWEPRYRHDDVAVSSWEAWEAGYIIRRGVNMTIPRALKPGNYLIRHEVINLEANLQLYPECAQLSITGDGNAVPSPEYLVEFPGAYRDDQEGLEIAGNIYSPRGHNTYNFTMPGPKVWIPEAQAVSPTLFGSGGAVYYCGEEGGTIVVANPNYNILNDFEACSTIFGDILVDPAFVYFILNGPQEITGTIIAHDNTILKYVSLADVRKLGGFSFASPAITGRIKFSEVTEIGFLEWRNVTFNRNTGVEWMEWEAPKLVAVSSLNVEGTDLSGFLPDYISYDGGFYYHGLEHLETADNIRVVDNRRMTKVVFPALKTISGPLIVGNNDGPSPRGKQDPDSRLISFPALESVGSVSIYYNDNFLSSQEGKVDLPVLGHVFGDFNVTNGIVINELSVPALTEVDGGLYILNNKGLKKLDFPELRKADRIVIDGGDSDNGGFETITFPVLERVGAFHVRAPASNFDCSSLDHIREIASEFSCTSSRRPSSTIGSPTPTPSGPASSPTGEPGPTNDPEGTDDPAPTGSPDSTHNPDATNGAAPNPTNGEPSTPSQSVPATSGASSFGSPFRIVSLLLERWLS
ncbi:hypothetical protein NUW58_g724 [Xylaria curta]|uniref:Uncharacterized protein n=1 Tax=Xylaria curta TaxID=42375 RepID=A0ACC1PRH2_9PEZI|nr:hypothetical protein NUW58_g724 [Xylaria curta]